MKKNHIALLTLSTSLLAVAALETMPTVAAEETTSATEAIYEVKAGDNLYRIALNHGITLEQLKAWNHLDSNFIQIGDKLVVKVLAETDNDETPTEPIEEEKDNNKVYEDLDQAIKAAKAGFDPAKHSNWKVDWTADGYVITYIDLVTDEKDEQPATSETEEPVNPTENVYTVKKGDSLYRIAQTYGVTVTQLKTWNHLDSNFIQIGDKLVVKAPAEVVNDETPTESIEEGTNNNKVYKDLDQAIKAAKAEFDPAKHSNWKVDWTAEGYVITYINKVADETEPVEQPTETEDTQTYTVKSGDSLYRIARQFNISVENLKTWNHKNGNLIIPGEKLIVTNSKTNEAKPVTTNKIYKDLNQAIKAAKNGFDIKKHQNWRVDWVKDGYIVKYILK